MKSRNNFVNFMISKMSIMLIILLSTAIVGNAANRKTISGLPGKPETNDTVYPLLLTVTPYVYPNGYNVSCFGFKDGSINLTVSGGVPPYIYTWSEGDSTKDIGSLAAGYYKVVVTDADSNEAEAEITLTQPNQLQRLSINGVVHKYPNGFNVTCYGCTDGSIDVNVWGGSGAYYYQWQDGPVTQDRTGLGVGQYAIIVRDSSVCAMGDQANMGFTVREPQQGSLQVNLTVNAYPNGYNVSCFGEKDGSISSITTGGTPPYTYKWSTGETTANISNTAAGYYEVYVKDAHQIMTGAGITLTQPKPLNELKVDGTVYTYPNGYNVSCNSCFNGSIDVTVTGGSGSYLYQWRDSVTTEDRTELGAGEYVVFIKDASECSNEKEYRLDFEVKGAPIDGWSMDGNEGTDPETQFLGTTDSADFVLKTNNVEQLRLSPSSDSTGIGLVSMTGDGTVTNNFSVGNTLNVTGNVSTAGKILTNRITSLDSILYLGDSSIAYLSSLNRLYADGIGSIKGMGLGANSTGKGINSLALGGYSIAYGGNSITIGNMVYADYSASNSIVMGSGVSTSKLFSNYNKPNTLMIGFNSDIPTLFVGTSVGVGTTGNIGIGTTTPKDKLQIGDGIGSITFGSALCSEAGYLTGYEGFNAKRARTNDNSASTWQFNTNSANSGGGVITADVTGSIMLIPVKSTGSDFTLTDEQLYKRRVVQIGAGTISTEGNLDGAYMMVNGKITAKEIEVSLDNWWDNVFEKNYKLTPLAEVEKYINEHKHLPDVPSANEVKEKGVNVGEMDATLLKKIEELTLYTIEISKQVEQLKKENEELKKAIINK